MFPGELRRLCGPKPNLLSKKGEKAEGNHGNVGPQPRATRVARLTTRISERPFFPLTISSLPLAWFPFLCLNAFFKVQK